jgi:hypothetical protein
MSVDGYGVDYLGSHEKKRAKKRQKQLKLELKKSGVYP